MKPGIVFTGGGTAGHVTPNIALIHELQQDDWNIAYIGSNSGIESGMIKSLGIPFYGISSGKLRRYFSLKNFIDPFKILWGVFQSFRLFRKLKPDVVFSKGGFVAFPVVVGAWLNRIPVVAHESDMSPGLANRLSFPFVNKICLTFEPAKNHFKNQDRVEVTGTPIRSELLKGDSSKALQLCGWNPQKPCILVIGGSLGAGTINRVIREAIEKITLEYQVIHVCGKGKVDPSLAQVAGYWQFEYVHAELADFFAAAAVLISRSGANSLYEILALAKPHILIPLSAKVSRGDQIQNARYFQQQGISIVIQDDQLTSERLFEALQEVKLNGVTIITKIKALNIQSATTRVISIIKEQAHVQSTRTA